MRKFVFGLALLLLLFAVLLPSQTTNTFCASNLACTVTGAYSFSQQLTSSVSTGTAPFSIASTTVVPNLNAQLHNGLTAPGSAIVGVSDSQTLTNKTLTSPTINTPTLDGTGAAHVATQVSAATNFGANLTAQTIVASMPSTTLVNLSANFVQSLAGVGCGAGSNTVFATFSFTEPGGTPQTVNTATFTVSANGTLDSGNTAGTATLTPFIMKAGTSLTYTATSTLASAGCSTVPQYTIYAKAFF